MYFSPDGRDLRAGDLAGVGHQVVVVETHPLGRPRGARAVGHRHDVRVRVELVLVRIVQRPVVTQHQAHEGLAVLGRLLHPQHDRLLDLGGLEVGGGLLGLLQEQS